VARSGRCRLVTTPGRRHPGFVSLPRSLIGPPAATPRICATRPSRGQPTSSPGIPPLGSALLGQGSLSARTPSVTPHADGPQVGEVTAAAGLWLDDVIDLGGSADADVGVLELTLVAVALEDLQSDMCPVARVGVEIRRWRAGPGSPPARGAPGRRLPARKDRDPVRASACEARPHHRGSSQPITE
jgi:hypothetical protein